MRFATVLLIAAVPTALAAQPERPVDHKPTTTKPVLNKPATTNPAPGQAAATQKPGKPTPGAQKPGAHKPGPHKPGANKPPAKPPAPKPAPPPAPTPTPEAAPDVHKGSNTGLPLPRYAALKTDDVNFRRGPGTRYPIEWVYKRRDLPVEIEREFEVWRLVSDPDGGKGWVQAATLTGRRTAIVTEAERTLRQEARETSGPVAKLEKGVIVRVRACEAKSDWCQVQVGDYRGYLRRNEIWGVQPGEVIP